MNTETFNGTRKGDFVYKSQKESLEKHAFCETNPPFFAKVLSTCG